MSIADFEQVNVNWVIHLCVATQVRKATPSERKYFSKRWTEVGTTRQRQNTKGCYKRRNKHYKKPLKPLNVALI